jgi:hypothetical protein
MTATFCTVPAPLETRTGAAHKAKLASIAAIMRRDNHRSCAAEVHDNASILLTASQAAFYGDSADRDLRDAFHAAVATYYAERKAGVRAAA